MNRRFWAPALFLLLQAVAARGEEGTGGCEPGFAPGDARLFDFVDTRASVDYDKLAGRLIGTIEYQVLPIFNEANPDEDNWLYRSFNFLHIETRPRTLQKQMIVSGGEPLDPDRIRENERLLRDNDYLSDAMILPRRICDGTVDLLVVVRDVWTLSPSATASRSGGENRTGAGISEDNLLGTGQQLSIGYSQDANRSSRTISYRVPDLFNNHSRLHLGFADSSDGHVVDANLMRPFYELDSRWSAGAALYEARRKIEIEEEGTVSNSYERESHHYEVFYGWSRGLRNGRVHRWRVGFTEDEDLFAPEEGQASDPPEDRRTRYPWLAWEYLENRYLTTSNITFSHRQEDLLLGATAYARLGYGLKSLGSSENAVIFLVTSGYTASFGSNHLLRVEAYTNGRFNTDIGSFDSTFYGTAARYYNFIDRKNRWYARVALDGGRDLESHEGFSLGGGETLRGYPDHMQRGDRRWLLSLERRHFTDVHLFNLAWLGGAAYVDAGQTWDSETESPGDAPVLSNLGFGLRLSPSKFGVDRVFHLDVAVPLSERDEIDSYQIIVAGRVDLQ